MKMEVSNNFEVFPYEGELGLKEGGITAYKNKLYSLAMGYLEPIAKHGDVDAQLYVGIMYLKGLHVKQNIEIGKNWLYQSAIQGSERVSEFLRQHGQNIRIGWNWRGLDDDVFLLEEMKVHNPEILQFLTDIKGNIFAQYNLGIMYQDGRGVTKDDAEAVKWYTLAAEQGHALAQ